MEALTCRVLPYAVADGPRNMAADETLLDAAVAGRTSLRFYGWSEPTLSLGYFQPEASRKDDARLAALPFVRRPSGGAALVHDDELTYALAVPGGRPWQPRGATASLWLGWMHAVIRAALERLGITTRTVVAAETERTHGVLCFGQWTAGDLVLGGAKVVGSAQRRHRGALMQHGAILLTASRHAPSLPGIGDLTNLRPEVAVLRKAIHQEISRQTTWQIENSRWTLAERERIAALAVTKYTQPTWNEKR